MTVGLGISLSLVCGIFL